MSLDEFKDSLSEKAPPKLNSHLEALWYDAKGDWSKAHRFVQIESDETASWVHAYLHRKEGDNANAGYWYDRAGKMMPDVSLEEEWEMIVSELLKKI